MDRETGAGTDGHGRFPQKGGAAGGATLWGCNETANAEIAALANVTMAFHLELDDVHRTSHTHPGLSVIPAALAVSEEKHLSPMKGEPEDPLSEPELRQKFNSLATDAVSAEHAERIWQAVFQIDERKGVTELTALLRVDR